MTEVRCVFDCKCALGEGPVWDVAEQALYFVDILGKVLNRFDPSNGARESWSMPEHISCFGLRQGGGAIVALRTGVHFFDFASGALEAVADPEANDARTRFSDGKVDRRGRFWAGTMPYEQFDPICNLYRFATDGSWEKVQDGLVIANGIGWSPDERTMYHTDTLARHIYAYDFDAATGAVANRRVLVEVPEAHGLPDGLTVDAEGFIWSAKFNGGRVIRYTPDGRLDRVLEMPVQRPTSCMFGGPNLDTLYVTSGGWAASPSGDFTPTGADGGLFAAEVGVTGLPETRFAG